MGGKGKPLFWISRDGGRWVVSTYPDRYDAYDPKGIGNDELKFAMASCALRAVDASHWVVLREMAQSIDDDAQGAGK